MIFLVKRQHDSVGLIICADDYQTKINELLINDCLFVCLLTEQQRGTKRKLEDAGGEDDD